MNHKIVSTPDRIEVEYGWKNRGQWMRLTASANGVPQLPAENSLEQYLTEHYWGYSQRRGRSTLEYQVTHPPWRVWQCSHAGFEGNGAELYGKGIRHATNLVGVAIYGQGYRWFN